MGGKSHFHTVNISWFFSDNSNEAVEKHINGPSLATGRFFRSRLVLSKLRFYFFGLLLNASLSLLYRITLPLWVAHFSNFIISVTLSYTAILSDIP